MAHFVYQARDAEGEITGGQITAPSTEQASKMLRAEGKFVVSITEKGKSDDAGDVMTLQQRAKRVKRDDVIYFAHQMAIMVETGVPLGQALESVAEQTSNEHFRPILEDVSDLVQSGTCLSDALDRYPKVFPNLMVSLLRASEASGTMSSMMDRIACYLTKERQTIKKIRGAMMYPMFMLFMAVSVTIFLLAFVLPRFSKIYEGRGAVLPAPTRILIATSDLVVNYWFVWVGSVFAIGLFYWWFSNQTAGRRAVDKVKLTLPVVGKIMNQLYLTRAMQTMGTMLSAGVPMLDMIAITRQVTNNVWYEDLWDGVDDQLRRGCQLSDPLFESALIPKSISRMISSGEKGGQIGKVMDRIATFCEHDFDESVKRGTEFIEPMMITFMGLLIGSIAISLLLPIFSIGKVMAG